MFVFDQWADSIASGDILSEHYVQPEHTWMKQIANIYFRDHPEQLSHYKTLAGPDSLITTPTKLLWEDWYGKHAFPHEPLYAYFLALNYKIFGKDVRFVYLWQMVFGVLTNLMVFLVARRYFGEFAGVVAAFFVVFFGPLLFFEMTLLRSTFAVFFTILMVYVSGISLQKNTFIWWILSGVVCGLATMVHAYFVLLAIIWLIFLFFYYYKKWQTFSIAATGFGVGLIFLLSPIFVRNVHLNLPVLSLSNNSAIGFITMNDNTFKSFNGWMANGNHVSDIMFSSKGNLIKTIVPTLKTHKDIGSYLSQVWDKFHATFSWYEIPNNVNFYFYRQYAPILSLTFLSFLVISPLALVGLCLAIVKKKQVWPLFLMMLVIMVPMLAFMVLSRYRIIFAVVLIPFAAYTIVELFTSWKGWKNIAIASSVLIIFFWTNGPRNELTVKLAASDYGGMFDIHHLKEIQEGVNKNDWKEVAKGFSSYIDKYEPEIITDMKPYYRCKDQNEAGILSHFALMHERKSTVLNLLADTVNAKKEAEISIKLKNVANFQ
jgi:4-amino-4-deoxy-L-arabinose transferase-like glycosyltransferase